MCTYVLWGAHVCKFLCVRVHVGRNVYSIFDSVHRAYAYILSCIRHICMSAWNRCTCVSECRCVWMCMGRGTYMYVCMSNWGIWMFTYKYCTREDAWEYFYICGYVCIYVRLSGKYVCEFVCLRMWTIAQMCGNVCLDKYTGRLTVFFLSCSITCGSRFVYECALGK